jgi:hypothetical protein
MNRLDLIIDALDVSESLFYDQTKLQEALQAARELQALKPVAWGSKSIYGGLEGLSFDKQPRFDTPLYALEETK